MTHELGHMWGHNDIGSSFGVGMMNGAPSAGLLSAWLHLYPIDVNSQVALGGATTRRPTTSTSVNGSSWSSLQIIGSAGVATTAPALGDTRPWWRTPLTTATTVLGGGVDFGRGSAGSWTDRPNPVTNGSAMPVSIANSTSGPTVVVWASNCTYTSGCDIHWAWTATEGDSWTSGTFTTANTFSKPFVQYDASRGRFVLAYLDYFDQRVRMSSALASSAPNSFNAWSSPSSTFATPIRHLGGMIFNSSGNGLLVASSGWGPDKGRLIQFDTTFSGSTYNLTYANYLTNTDSRTRRPFGIAYDSGPNVVMVVWRDVGTNRNMAMCTKSSFSAATRCATPTYPISAIWNGVDLAYDAPNNVFTAGFSH